MNETQIFLNTGKVLWIAICSASILSALAGAVVAPIMIYKSVRWHLWKWILSAELAKSGFSEADIRFALSVPGGLPCEYDKFIETVKRIKERGDIAKRLSARNKEVMLMRK